MKIKDKSWLKNWFKYCEVIWCRKQDWRNWLVLQCKKARILCILYKWCCLLRLQVLKFLHDSPTYAFHQCCFDLIICWCIVQNLLTCITDDSSRVSVLKGAIWTLFQMLRYDQIFCNNLCFSTKFLFLQKKEKEKELIVLHTPWTLICIFTLN